MKKSLVLTLVMVLLVSASAFAEFKAMYTEVAPVLDGVLDDVWATAPVFEITMDNYEAIGGSYESRGPGGFAAGAKFRLLWDEENLYFFADVADRDGTYNATPGSNFINNNCLQVGVKVDMESEDIFLFDLIADSNVGTPLIHENWVIAGFTELPIAGLTFYGGYTIEIAFPWSVLMPSAVAEGEVMKFGPVIIDASDFGERRGFLFPFEGGLANLGNPDAWKDMVLVK